jgi:hypothetical protein
MGTRQCGSAALMWRLSRIETLIFVAFVALALAAAMTWG